jgi:hypothetical protein
MNPTVLFRTMVSTQIRVSPVQRTSSRLRSAARAFLWFVLAVPVIFMLGSIAGESIRPEIVDPDYYYRKTLLLDRMAERPGQHVALLVGSSRTAHGFLPERQAEIASAGPPILWFNFSHIGFGPVMNAMTLERLIRDGVAPNTIILEIMPAFFVKEDMRFQARHVSPKELLSLRRYTSYLASEWAYARTRLSAPSRLLNIFDPLDDHRDLGPYGDWRAYDIQPATPELHQQRINAQRHMIGKNLKTIHARPGAARALADSMAMCREHGIELILLRTPEGPVVRSWYDPEKLAAFDQWIVELANQNNVRIVDARNWLTENDFKDSHHPTRDGAVKFTERFIREVSPTLGR